ncbi:MAG: hypothetical protein Q3965_01745 [Rothia sp. (in: high G+C Gram-positive bacteria)]|nr:hypothetical protein [Rothia sp. (in: high G+C Gram-positive bacteria)]
MGQKHNKDGAQRLAGTLDNARPQNLRETVTTSISSVSKLPGHLGEFSGRAVGVLTKKDARSVRRRLTIITVLVSLIAMFVAAAGNYYSIPHSPEERTERYFSALHSGDYLAGMPSSAYSTFDMTYLPSAAYRAAGGRVTEFSITGSQNLDSHHSQVHVSATLNGQERTFTLPLERIPKTGPYNDLWEFTTPTYSTLPIDSGVPLTSLSVNGVTVDLPQNRRAQTDSGFRWNIPLLPGSYTFALPEHSYYTLVTSPTVTTPLLEGADQLAPLNLKLSPSPRMWNEANDLVESWLERCESARRLDVEGCPVSKIQKEKSKATISDVQWKLKDRPAFVLEQDTNRPDVWRASRYRPATFELTYLADGKAQRETIDFYISAEVISNGSQADISVGLGGSEESEAALRQTITSEQASKSALEKYSEAL